ncbi:MAG: hypothetical protein ACJ8FY_06910 [Gemmataceae bacterium]
MEDRKNLVPMLRLGTHRREALLRSEPINRAAPLDPRSSILDPRSSILDPRSSILHPPSSVLYPL